MKKLYVVWFKGKTDLEDRIRCVSLNWKKAEQMALNLELHLQSQGESVEVGVKSYLDGSISLDDPTGCNYRWSKTEFEAAICTNIEH